MADRTILTSTALCVVSAGYMARVSIGHS